MKINHRIIFLCSVISVGHLALALPVEWTQALQKGIIRAEFVSLGGSSGSCVRAKLTNKSTNAVEVQFAPGGGVISTGDENTQRLLVVTDQMIALAPGATENVTLRAFCIDPSRGTPKEGSTFKLTKDAKKEYAEVAALAHSNKVDDSMFQSAVWATSSDYPVAAIDGGTADARQALRTYCANLRNEPVPTHSVDCGEILNRPWNNEVLEVKGTLEFDIFNPVRADLVLLGPDGKLIMRFFQNKPLAQARHTQNFNLTGTGLLRGDYVFRLLVNGETEKELIIKV